ncbi:MAG: cytochrome-c peroxidase [Bacteroidia bacterium]|nr:cytochrome-c peroxidase [Bacteroidia bacterium]
MLLLQIRKQRWVTFSFIITLILIIYSFSYNNDSFVEKYDFPIIKQFPKMPHSKKNPVTISGVELGRFLFYDPILSIDSNMSCSSCHRQSHAFSYELNYVITPKELHLNGRRSILPLFNLAWSSTYFWDGRVTTIEEQVFHPVRNKNEMNSNWLLIEKRINRSDFYKNKFKNVFGNKRIDSVMIAKAIAQFERTLLSYNSKFDKVQNNEAKFTKDEQEGYELMLNKNKGNCFSCHTTGVNDLKGEKAFANDGGNTEKELKLLPDRGRELVTKKMTDIGKFRIPTLRNIGLTAPYMHNGIHDNLEHVINFYSDGIQVNNNIDGRINNAHAGGVHFTTIEKRKIALFLLTLTDSSFITNKAFSNPFENEKNK